MMTSPQKLTIALLLLFGLLGGLWSARNRMAVEAANRTVALCIDDLEVRQLAALTGHKPEALLAQLKAAGATHVAVSERTVGDLLQSGELHGQGGLLVGSPQIAQSTITRVLAAGLGLVPDTCNIRGLLPVGGTMPELGVLYDPHACTAIKAAGLQIVARPMPDYLLTPKAVEASLQGAKDTSARIVCFNGVSVAGGAKLAKETADILNRLGLQFGFVELVPQDGAANLAAALHYQIIRTHSISQDEMLKTPVSRGLDRFTLAVTERGIRLCYIRLTLNPQPDIVAANVAYLQSIHEGLAKAGYTFGEPQPYQPLSVPKPALALLALGVIGGALWLLMEMLRPNDAWFWGLGAIGVVMALGGSMAAPGLIQALFPLKAAVVFPTLAILLGASQAGAVAEGRATAGLLRAVALVIVAAAITAVGGFLIAGMLSATPYMTQIAQFRGVKLAELLPMVLVLGVMVARTYGSGSVSPRTPDERAAAPATASAAASEWGRLRGGLIAVAEAVVKYWHAIAVFLVLGLVAFMIMRSGNESAVEVSGFELKLRALLDQILVVRPRTKEILFGFPALLLGLTLLLRGRPRTAWLWLTFGVIGLISMTNTFCHLHTPLTVSLLRVVNGVWVGLLVGILWLVAKAVGERILRLVWWTSES